MPGIVAILINIPTLTSRTNPLHGAGMASISITCPNCAKVLRPKSRPPEGKKVKCPSCESAFMPEITEEEDENARFQEKPSSRVSANNTHEDHDEDAGPPRNRRRDDDEDDDDLPVV